MLELSDPSIMGIRMDLDQMCYLLNMSNLDIHLIFRNLTNMVMMFNPKPALIISTVFSFPVPNTDNKKMLMIPKLHAPIAFGPVDIGSMKAQDATRVAGSMKKRGLTWRQF